MQLNDVTAVSSHDASDAYVTIALHIADRRPNACTSSVTPRALLPFSTRRYCEYTSRPRCSSPVFFFFSSRRRHTRSLCDWSSDVCSSDLEEDDRHPSPIVIVADAHVAEEHDEGVVEHAAAVALGRVLEIEEELGEARAVVEIGRASCRERV